MTKSGKSDEVGIGAREAAHAGVDVAILDRELKGARVHAQPLFHNRPKRGLLYDRGAVSVVDVFGFNLNIHDVWVV